MKPKEWRVAKNLTLAEMAEKLGLRSPGHISDIENGNRGASGRVMRKYHKVTNGEVSLGDFHA